MIHTTRASYVKTETRKILITLLVILVPGSNAIAQLVDQTRITPVIGGGGIAKSLQQQIDAGYGDPFNYGTSAYIIKRDPARSIRRGRQLFQRKFTAAQGLGPRVDHDSSGDVHHNAALGAGISDSCAACHGRPRGSAGFGGDVATRPDSRDAPHLFGIGLIEMLADEVTRDLRAIRDSAMEQATGSTNSDDTEGRHRQNNPRNSPRDNHGAVRVKLSSKGIDFGYLTASPDGSFETSELTGVNEDLRVRPFFADGRGYSIREFVVGAFNDEMGLQSPDPVLCAATAPDGATEVQSLSGMIFDPTIDTVSRPPVCDAASDADNDGVQNELDPALVDHMEFYLLNYFRPGRGQITRKVQLGESLMGRFGCTACHIKDLKIDADRRIADVDTRFDAQRGIFNRLFATATTLFQKVDDGHDYPQLLPTMGSFVVRDVWTDLKRHDLGPSFHERMYDGSIHTEFVTEPLWGVGSTSPYGHDGRSINLTEVILRHGGEAENAAKHFRRAPPQEQDALVAFLNTLILFPPDDTASNLNPGDRNSDNPQEPANHGSIALPALYQIDMGQE